MRSFNASNVLVTMDGYGWYNNPHCGLNILVLCDLQVISITSAHNRDKNLRQNLSICCNKLSVFTQDLA